MEITAKQMNELAKDGTTVFVIINGKWYEYKPETTGDNEQEETA